MYRNFSCLNTWLADGVRLCHFYVSISEPFFFRVLVVLYLGLTVSASVYSVTESYCKCIFLHNEWNLITSSHCNLVVLCVWLVCCSVFISCRGLHYALLCSVFLYCSLLTWLLLIWRFIILTPLVEFPYFVGLPPPSLVLRVFLKNPDIGPYLLFQLFFLFLWLLTIFWSLPNFILYFILLRS